MYKKSESDISVCYTINRADIRRSCRWYTVHCTLYLRPTGSDPEVVCQKNSFLKVSVWPFCSPWKTLCQTTLCSSYEKQGRNLLSPLRHWAPFVRPLKRLGVKIDVWENPVVYASTRDWSCLYGAIRSEPETAAQSSCSHF